MLLKGLSYFIDTVLNLILHNWKKIRSVLYDQESINVINATKHVLDLPALSIKLHEPDGGNLVEGPEGGGGLYSVA